MSALTEHQVERIPAVCTSEDICRILQMSRRQFHQLRRDGTFPIPEIEPRLDHRPRFSGDLVRRYINGEFKPARRSA